MTKPFGDGRVSGPGCVLRVRRKCRRIEQSAVIEPRRHIDLAAKRGDQKMARMCNSPYRVGNARGAHGSHRGKLVVREKLLKRCGGRRTPPKPIIYVLIWRSYGSNSKTTPHSQTPILLTRIGPGLPSSKLSVRGTGGGFQRGAGRQWRLVVATSMSEISSMSSPSHLHHPSASAHTLLARRSCRTRTATKSNLLGAAATQCQRRNRKPICVLQQSVGIGIPTMRSVRAGAPNSSVARTGPR